MKKLLTIALFMPVLAFGQMKTESYKYELNAYKFQQHMKKGGRMISTGLMMMGIGGAVFAGGYLYDKRFLTGAGIGLFGSGMIVGINGGIHLQLAGKAFKKQSVGVYYIGNGMRVNF